MKERMKIEECFISSHFEQCGLYRALGQSASHSESMKREPINECCSEFGYFHLASLVKSASVLGDMSVFVHMTFALSFPPLIISMKTLSTWHLT